MSKCGRKNLFSLPASHLHTHLIITTNLRIRYYYISFYRWGSWNTEYLSHTTINCRARGEILADGFQKLGPQIPTNNTELLTLKGRFPAWKIQDTFLFPPSCSTNHPYQSRLRQVPGAAWSYLDKAGREGGFQIKEGPKEEEKSFSLLTIIDFCTWHDPVQRTHSFLLKPKVKYYFLPYLNNFYMTDYRWGFPSGSNGKKSAWDPGGPGLIAGQEDPLEKGMATHSNVLAWRIP